MTQGHVMEGADDIRLERTMEMEMEMEMQEVFFEPDIMDSHEWRRESIPSPNALGGAVFREASGMAMVVRWICDSCSSLISSWLNQVLKIPFILPRRFTPLASQISCLEKLV